LDSGMTMDSSDLVEGRQFPEGCEYGYYFVLDLLTRSDQDNGHERSSVDEYT
jgi:hypothetical protein